MHSVCSRPRRKSVQSVSRTRRSINYQTRAQAATLNVKYLWQLLNNYTFRLIRRIMMSQVCARPENIIFME